MHTHPRMLPRVVKGDQKGPHGITNSVQKSLKTACIVPPTRGRTGGILFRIDFRISGCWRTAREKEPRLEEESG